jgi:hypothetical protein
MRRSPFCIFIVEKLRVPFATMTLGCDEVPSNVHRSSSSSSSERGNAPRERLLHCSMHTLDGYSRLHAMLHWFPCSVPYPTIRGFIYAIPSTSILTAENTRACCSSRQTIYATQCPP